VLPERIRFHMVDLGSARRISHQAKLTQLAPGWIEYLCAFKRDSVGMPCYRLPALADKDSIELTPRSVACHDIGGHLPTFCDGPWVCCCMEKIRGLCSRLASAVVIRPEPGGTIMRTGVLEMVLARLAILIVVPMISSAAVAQTPGAESDASSKGAPVYDPYPPGIRLSRTSPVRRATCRTSPSADRSRR
jgi:hypothetical protein